MKQLALPSFARGALFGALLCLGAASFADISFGSPDINQRNEVLFTMHTDVPGMGSYDTAFLKRLDANSVEQLSFYPEAMESLSGGGLLQIRNRFGTCRYDSAAAKLAWVYDSKPFYADGKIKRGLLEDVATSPDGRYIVSVEPVSPSRGRLSLYDTVRAVRCVISDSVERGAVPAVWSPDSSVVIYALSGTLYFSRPEAFFTVSPIDERFRVLGPGDASSVSWFAGNRLLYAKGSSVYVIQAAELLARSLYSALLGSGVLAGKLPAEFDATTDRICASSDGSAVLYARGDRSVYYCPLTGDDYVSSPATGFLPYLLLPGNTARISLVWSAEGVPVVLTEAVESGKKAIKAWQLTSGATSRVFEPLAVPSGSRSFSVSADGSAIAFLAPGAVSVYALANWKEVSAWREEPVVSVAWGESGVLYLGGVETIRLWRYRAGDSSLILLSSVASCGWDESGTMAMATAANRGTFAYQGALVWSPATQGRLRAPIAINASWRLYADSGKGYYANMLYARSALSPGGTKPLVPEPEAFRSPGMELGARGSSSATASSAGASKTTGVAGSSGAAAARSAHNGAANGNGVFSHGSRTRFRQVALVFDAVDNLDGLADILYTLDRYGIKSTFFLNGEFIRQHPEAVNEIVKARHQTASLFFTAWDLSGTQFRIDEDFVIRGLARNEDDFYDTTGQELTLLWHAPYYVNSPTILEAGRKAGYTLIAPDLTVLDWVPSGQNEKLPGLYRDSSALVDEIVGSYQAGSIIPIRVGKVSGGRADYLFDRVALIVNALIENGYEPVTLDTLIKNSR